ncbi:tyrosine-type recombinase/integrase [Streptomyces flavofungini]|uniref:tyrosine-type recombinase/integrase n=1 Tax=Streptomyces flavofungini TaxID=68200 RepID=UPI0025B15AE1|nr:site-specific integrase [Streptomyces flavofungini]WJV47642.1 site-specific integrase [Streptomyces flavofungini]
MADPIKKITLKGGATRYRFVVDAGYAPKKDKATGEVVTDPETGKPVLQRRQLTVTKDTRKEALAEYARIQHQKANGTFVAPTKTTVAELVDMWLKVSTRDVERATARSYEDAMRYVRTHLGHRRLQELTEDDIDSLVDWMLTSARRIGGKPGTGLSVRTVSLTLGRLRAALNLAIRRGLVARNVAEHASIPRQARKDDKARKKARTPWTEDEVKQFLAHVASDRLHAVMLLSLIGMRPAEVCGVRWSDVDLDAGTIRVEATRTLVAGEVIEKDTKSESGERWLPLPAVVLVALKLFRARQAKEKLKAGEGYAASGRVVVDELGAAVKTDWLRRRAYERMQSAGVRKVRLYDARHACLSWMANNGVPDTVVSAWAGHADLGFTKRVYVHPDPQSLKAGSDKLGELLG